MTRHILTPLAVLAIGLGAAACSSSGDSGGHGGWFQLGSSREASGSAGAPSGRVAPIGQGYGDSNGPGRSGYGYGGYGGAGDPGRYRDAPGTGYPVADPITPRSMVYMAPTDDRYEVPDVPRRGMPDEQGMRSGAPTWGASGIRSSRDGSQ